MRIKNVVVASGVAISTILAATASANSAVAGTANTEPSVVTFGHFSSSSYEDVYETILEANGEEATAAFFDAAQAQTVPVELPGLEELSAEERRTVLQESAEAAESGASIDSIDDSSARTVNPGYTYYLDGQPINNDYSWQTTERFTVSECSIFGCEDHGWIEFRVTTDPGEFATKNALNFVTFGTLTYNVNFTTDVWSSSGGYISSVGPKHWNVPGTGSQWNSPRESLDGANFKEYYLMEVEWQHQGDTIVNRKAWQSGTTLPCGDADGSGAFRCHF